MASTLAPGLVKKTPLDVNSTTLFTGQAEKLNVATGELEPNPVKASSITRADSKISDGKLVDAKYDRAKTIGGVLCLLAAVALLVLGQGWGRRQA